MRTQKPVTADVGRIKIAVEPYSVEASSPVNDGLAEFNRSVVGPFDFEPLLVVARNDAGVIVGGGIGGVFLSWLTVQVLWVEEAVRRKGVGSQLLRALEAEGIRLGATRAMVDTMEYQAPGFYQRHGYTEFGRVRKFVRDWDRIYYERQLIQVTLH